MDGWAELRELLVGQKRLNLGVASEPSVLQLHTAACRADCSHHIHICERQTCSLGIKFPQHGLPPTCVLRCKCCVDVDRRRHADLRRVALDQPDDAHDLARGDSFGCRNQHGQHRLQRRQTGRTRRRRCPGMPRRAPRRDALSRSAALAHTCVRQARSPRSSTARPHLLHQRRTLNCEQPSLGWQPVWRRTPGMCRTSTQCRRGSTDARSTRSRTSLELHGRVQSTAPTARRRALRPASLLTGEGWPWRRYQLS